MAALKSSTVTKDELKKTLTAIEGQSSTIQQIKSDIISKASKYVSDVATVGYCDTSKLKDEIKGIVDRALQVCPPSSSSTKGDIGALATKADFMALGDQYLTNLNCVAHELSTEGNKLRPTYFRKWLP